MGPNTVADIAASVSAFAAAIGLIAAAFQVHYLGKQIFQDHQWKRHEKALLFSQVYHPAVREARARLWSSLGNVQTRIPWKELENKIAANPTIRDDLNTILIYIEHMGLAVRHDVADFRMIYDINGTEIIFLCDILREYIDVTRRDNPRIWQNVDSLVAQLVKERETETERGA
jgi:hypothetical protein